MNGKPVQYPFELDGRTVTNVVRGLYLDSHSHVYFADGSMEQRILPVVSWTNSPDEVEFKGLQVCRFPDFYLINLRTGKPVAVGDLLPNGESVVDVGAAHVRTRGFNYFDQHSSQLVGVPVTSPDMFPPEAPPYRRPCESEASTGTVLINDQWRPYREVGYHDGVWYWKGEHLPIRNVAGETKLYPRSELVETYNGLGLRPRSECFEIDGVWYTGSQTVVIYDIRYPRHICVTVVDVDGDVAEYHPPNTELPNEYVEVPEIGGNHYALKDDTKWARDVECHHPTNLCHHWDGGWYTEAYIDSETFVCDCCDGRFHNDYYGGDGLCETCYDEREEEVLHDSRIRDYGCRSASGYTPEKDVPLKFGIEFEVETDSGLSYMLDQVEEAIPSRYAVFKEDGSISYERGCEIVTRPDCPSVHKRVWRKVFDNAGSCFRPSRSCGIHIHVSREPLGALQIGRLLVFLNHADNRELVTKVAGRYDGDYCRVRDKKLGDGRLSGPRHDILNVSNDETIEFRMFSSQAARTADLFIKNIEFVEAALAFTSPANTGVRELSADKFVEFVKRRAKAFPALRQFLAPTPRRAAVSA